MTSIGGLMRGMATLREVARPAGELGMSKPIECDTFPFNALTLLVG